MSQQRTPERILILGSGVFGLSTAWALTRRPAYANVSITLVSPDLAASSTAQPRKHSSSSLGSKDAASAGDLQDPPDSTNSSSSQSSPTLSTDRTTPASIDTTRIIRADYADPLYASLAQEAQQLWRTPEWGGSDAEGTSNATAGGGAKRYHENGLLLTADAGGSGEAYMRKSFENVRRQQQQAPASGFGATSPLDSTSRRRSPQPTLLNEDQIRQAMRTQDSHAAKGTGNIGYINAQSGWADAEACMRELEARVRETRRIEMVQGEVARLATSALTPPMYFRP